MKVLIFTQQFHQLGGAERLGVELSEELNYRSIHADLMSMYSVNLQNASEYKEKFLNKGIPKIHFLNLNVHPSFFGLVKGIFRLRKIIKKEKYDIIETSLITPTIIAAWATLGFKVHHIAGIHDVFCKKLYNGLKHKFWKFSIRINCNIRYYAISEYAKKYWIDFSKTDSKHTRTVLNSINDEYFASFAKNGMLREEFNIHKDAKIVLFVGRMIKRKGIDTVLEALGPILHTSNIFLLFIGGTYQSSEGFFPDEDGLLDRMQQQIQKNGWTDRVKFIGFRNDIPKIMACADVLVHPARIEGFGLVLAEALAAGLPVVASNVEGIPEVLSETDSIMVAPNNPNALQEAVIKTLNRSSAETEEAISKGRMKADKFRTERRANSMIQLFEDVLSGIL